MRKCTEDLVIMTVLIPYDFEKKKIAVIKKTDIEQYDR